MICTYIAKFVYPAEIERLVSKLPHAMIICTVQAHLGLYAISIFEAWGIAPVLFEYFSLFKKAINSP